MRGTRHTATGAHGVQIGLITAGDGPELLLVHGGMAQIEAWEPIWETLTDHWRVTAMDRRGRGTSGDADRYEIAVEYEDIRAVAAHLTAGTDRPVDVFAHSYGATCTLGALAAGARLRRAVLYEPAGRETVTGIWVKRATGLVADGQPGRAMMSFLTEIIGMDDVEIQRLRDAPMSYDVMEIVCATLPREAHALLGVDLREISRPVSRPVLLLVGERSPSWAQEITDALTETLPTSRDVTLPGVGHQAIHMNPHAVVTELRRFLSAR